MFWQQCTSVHAKKYVWMNARGFSASRYRATTQHPPSIAGSPPQNPQRDTRSPGSRRFFFVLFFLTRHHRRDLFLYGDACVCVCVRVSACVRMSEKSFYNFSFIKLDRRRRRSRCCKHTKNAFASELREFSSTMFPYHIWSSLAIQSLWWLLPLYIINFFNVDILYFCKSEINHLSRFRILCSRTKPGDQTNEENARKV